MANDFEEGKQLIVEGFEEFLKLYSPYMKIMKGATLLGIKLYGEDAVKDLSDYGSLLEIGLQTFIGSLKAANSAEEIQQAIDNNERYFNMVFPKRGEVG